MSEPEPPPDLRAEPNPESRFSEGSGQGAGQGSVPTAPAPPPSSAPEPNTGDRLVVRLIENLRAVLFAVDRSEATGGDAAVEGWDEAERVLREALSAPSTSESSTHEPVYDDDVKAPFSKGVSTIERLFSSRTSSFTFNHRGEQIVHEASTINGSGWRLASGGPKRVVAHPLGYYVGFDERLAMGEAQTDAAMGAGEYAAGRRIWDDRATPKFFDTYADGRVVTEDAFHQALTWLVTP